LHGHPNMDLAIFDATGARLVGTPGFRPYGPLMSLDAGRGAGGGGPPPPPPPPPRFLRLSPACLLSPLQSPRPA
ncbi:hypothetical protein K6W80_20375, partial [Burkholderia contaminans]|nr:hypothetical protein [Burkholderia contaminans]